MDLKVGHHIHHIKALESFTSKVCNAFLDFAGGTKSLAQKFGAERAVNLWN